MTIKDLNQNVSPQTTRPDEELKTLTIAKIAESSELKPKNIRTLMTGYFELVPDNLKKNGMNKFAGIIHMKLNKKPFNKEFHAFEAKPVTKTVICLAI